KKSNKTSNQEKQQPSIQLSNCYAAWFVIGHYSRQSKADILYSFSTVPRALCSDHLTMSMLDAFFSNKGFKAVKCKTLLKLTIPRIKLLRNRREIQIRQMRRDIAKLLETGQEATARIRVEHIIREENMMAAQEILELFCELISVRLPIIEAQKECPLDLKEAISSVCFAAPRCADLPELMQVQMLFTSKYGKEFVAAATELMPDCGVNRQIVELLSVRAPSLDIKLKLLKAIAEEHELDWDPAGSEAELSKPHEDLLNGPAQIVSGSKLPFPDEKHDEVLSSDHAGATNELPADTDTSGDELDFPDVPKAVIRSNTTAASSPDMTQPTQPALHPDTYDWESEIHSVPSDSPVHGSHFKHEVEESSMASKNEIPEYMVGDSQEKQFLPFVAPPHASSVPKSNTRSIPSNSKAMRKHDIDLQDILVSAQAAAESAERAAVAARAAATFAEAKIKELLKVNSDKSLDLEADNPFNKEAPDLCTMVEKAHVNHHYHSASDLNGEDKYQLDEHQQTSEVPETLDQQPGMEFDSPRDNNVHKESPRPELQRITSIDEDPYFSYPNLYSSQKPNAGSSSRFVSDDSRSPR
ncbi:IST1-like protein, partial [Linum perenne]